MVTCRGGYHPPAVTSLASPMGKLSSVCETDEVTAKNETTGTSSVTFGDSFPKGEAKGERLRAPCIL